MDEKQLLETYVKARSKLESSKEIIKIFEEELSKAESEIIEFLEAANKKDTGMYPDLGKLSITAPQVYASIKEENKEKGFAYLKQMNRADLIKETVNSNSLRSFVREIMESGQEVPDCISFYLKPAVKFTRS